MKSLRIGATSNNVLSLDTSVRIDNDDAIATEHFTRWVGERFQTLLPFGAPLIVPLTATFKPGSIRSDEVLKEFERFYARLCSRLVNNHERLSKRHLLPFAIAWRDDPTTRPDKHRARPAWYVQYFSHPSVAPHVHGVLVIHPQLVGRFREIAGDLEAEWRSIKNFRATAHGEYPVHRNGTLHLDIESGERISRGLAGGTDDADEARAHLTRWLGYSSKLTRRWGAGESDAFTVLPTAPKRPSVLMAA